MITAPPPAIELYVDMGHPREFVLPFRFPEPCAMTSSQFCSLPVEECLTGAEAKGRRTVQRNEFLNRLSRRPRHARRFPH